MYVTMVIIYDLLYNDPSHSKVQVFNVPNQIVKM